MRVINQDEICNISGGEATCTISAGTSTGVSCTGTVNELGTVAVQAYAFLATSPFTIPGIIYRLTN